MLLGPLDPEPVRHVSGNFKIEIFIFIKILNGKLFTLKGNSLREVGPVRQKYPYRIILI